MAASRPAQSVQSSGPAFLDGQKLAVDDVHETEREKM
jgi:hypothetical protein